MKLTQMTQPIIKRGVINYDHLPSSEDDVDDDDHHQERTMPLIAPSLFWVHLSALSAQSLFGGGAIVGELGLSATNPVWFAALREGASGPILCAIAYWKDGATPSLSDWTLFVGPGLHLFVNQFCYIIGLKVSSGITASAWMPSQGILAVLYGLCLGIEEVDCYKISGILIGSTSALLMILFEERSDADSEAADSLSILGGSAMFFLSCSATVFYLISSKRALEKYPPSTVTGYSYLVTTALMAVAAVIVARSPSLLDAVCPDCNGDPWRIPRDSLYALSYWICAQSVAAYLLMSWTNRWADASLNLAYSAVQPLVSVLCAEIFILARFVPRTHRSSLYLWGELVRSGGDRNIDWTVSSHL